MRSVFQPIGRECALDLRPYAVCEGVTVSEARPARVGWPKVKSAEVAGRGAQKPPGIWAVGVLRDSEIERLSLRVVRGASTAYYMQFTNADN